VARFYGVTGHLSFNAVGDGAAAGDAFTLGAAAPGSSPLSGAGSPAAVAPVWETTGVAFADLPDAALYPPRYSYTVTGSRRREAPAVARPQLGARATVGGAPVAVFKYKGQPLVVGGVCPHAGGDIAAGDIEEYEHLQCVTCPRHNFLFDTRSGDTVVPSNKSWVLPVLPARVDAGTGEVLAGLPGLPSATFAAMDF
jgi:nitrite reductase/ring-hydroxylating ferredoxin subunit